MKYPLIFIIILYIIEIICIILYLGYYSEIYDNKYHELTRDIYEAENKKEIDIVEEFENIFGELCKGLLDFSCLKIDLTIVLLYIICIIIGILSTIGSFAYCCAKNNIKGAIVVFIISAALNIVNIVCAFEKDEINIKGNIYQYEDELNSRIKDAVDMIHTRSSYLKATSFLILIIIIVIISNLFLLKHETDNIENLNRNNKGNNNMQDDLKQIIIN